MKYLVVFLLLIPIVGCKTISNNPNGKSGSTEVNKNYIQKFHEGLRLKMNGQVDDAIKSLESAVSFAPKEDAPHFALAQCYLIKNDIVIRVKKRIKIDELFVKMELIVGSHA